MINLSITFSADPSLCLIELKRSKFDCNLNVPLTNHNERVVFVTATTNKPFLFIQSLWIKVDLYTKALIITFNTSFFLLESNSHPQIQKVIL